MINSPLRSALTTIAFACTLLLLGCQQKQTKTNTDEAALKYKKGMVVCAYPDAAQAGLDILKKGGNAIDAAVAVQFALAVTFPEAGNIGGGGFMVYRGANGETASLDFREKAPGTATTNMFLDAKGNVVPNMSLITRKAAGVPGSVDGMITAHKKYGKLSWAEDLQPAIDLAAKGFKPYAI